MTDRHEPPHHHEHHPEGTDAFTRWGEDAAGLLETHWRKIVGVAVVVVVLVAVWMLHVRSREAAEAAAQERLVKIVAVYPANGGNIPESSIRDAASRYEAFLKDAPEGAARDTARLYLGVAYAALGERNQARTVFQGLLTAPQIFSAPARLRLAYLALADGDRQAAARAFDDVVANAPALAPQADLELGRLAEQGGDQDAAIAAYRKVTGAYAGTPQAAEARTRLKALGVEEEPTIPEPATTVGSAPAAPPAEAPKAPAKEPAKESAKAPAKEPATPPAPAPKPTEGKTP